MGDPQAALSIPPTPLYGPPRLRSPLYAPADAPLASPCPVSSTALPFCHHMPPPYPGRLRCQFRPLAESIAGGNRVVDHFCVFGLSCFRDSCFWPNIFIVVCWEFDLSGKASGFVSLSPCKGHSCKRSVSFSRNRSLERCGNCRPRPGRDPWASSRGGR